MVAMGVDEDELERRLDERPMHQGCMAGFLHLFDRPQILSGRRLHGSHRRLMSSGSSGSATPSERSMPLGHATPAPSSPDMTPPAAPRPSLQLPPLDPKDTGTAGVCAAPSWRLPRLSLDSRAVVDARGKLRPREIRTSGGAPPSPSSAAGDDRRSPSVVARLMGLDALPHGEAAAAAATGENAGAGDASPAALRRSASERVPRGDPSRFRFVDPAFFERPASPLMQRPSPPPPPAAAPATEAAMMVRRAAPDPACPRAFQRRSRFDAREVFPDPARRAGDAAAGGTGAAAGGNHGEIALYGEIERRLRKRGIAEPARDLETLKQILEALQLKGLLHHAPPNAPPPHVRAAPPPPIVLMRPSSRAPAPEVMMPPAARLTPVRRLRVDVDRARRPRSPDPSPSPARSPASPARRGPHSPQRRVSPAAQSPKQHQQQQSSLRKPSGGFDSAAARARIARRAAHNAAALSPDDEASTTFSDGGSSSSFSASSRWDMDPQQPDTRTDRVLERCGKLLSSIQAFTGGDAAGSDQQPSPVSVLDAAAFLADEDSPPSSSSGSKRAIDFSSVVGRSKLPPPPAAATASDPEDDEWALAPWPLVGPESGNPDYAYVAEVVRLFGGARSSSSRRLRDPSDVYKAAEEQWARRGLPGGGDTWRQHDWRLLCGAVGESLERQRAAWPWEPEAWLRGAELVDHVWAEVRRAGEPVAADAEAAGVEAEDLNGVTCGAIRRDMAADEGPWAPKQRKRVVCGEEAAEAVLQIERLVFKDLVADTIRELADVGWSLPRRKLVF